MDKTHFQGIIRNLYLYLVAAISLFMIAFSTIDLISLALRTYVFPKADLAYEYYPKQPLEAYCTVDKDGKRVCPTAEEVKQREEDDKKRQEEQAVARKQQDLVRNIALFIVAIPLFSYHWMLIRRDRTNS